VTASADNTPQVWDVATAAPNIVATACKMLGRNHDTSSLLTRYSIEVKDPICAQDAPGPDPSRMIDR
jgi:hypothetical protein